MDLRLGDKEMITPFSFRWVVVAVSAAMLLVLAAACGETKTIEVPGETVVMEKEVIKTVEVPGQTVTTEVIKEVPGETVLVTTEVIKEVAVPGETVVVEKEVIKTIAGPERVVTKEVQAESDRWTRNVFGQLVENPQYGGSISIGQDSITENFDPWYGYSVAGPSVNTFELVLQRLGNANWGFDSTGGGTASRYLHIPIWTGELAKSWEISSDLNTYTFDIRKNVYWHNKAPMNGRELTASDIEFTFQRNMALGSFAEAEKGPGWWKVGNVPMESVEATDEFTLVVKTHTPALDTLDSLVCPNVCLGNLVVPPEVIEEHGDMTNWEHVVGTGPYEITGHVPGSSTTYTKNPNYWNFDPQHPGNRLPYIDEIKYVVMPDKSLMLAALRTGKVAMGSLYWDLTYPEITSLVRTNPELTKVDVKGGAGTTPTMRMDKPPYNDKNVRIAMQKAINLTELNFAYYGGNGDSTPWGYVTSYTNGAQSAYADWSEDVKWQYEYDPLAAEKLLDDAGYPRDADGIRFKAGWDVSTAWGHDVDLAQLVTSYFDKIGVDITVNSVADSSVMQDRLSAGTHGGMTAGCCRHFNVDPYPSIRYRYYGDPGLYHGVTDSEFNAIMDKIALATSNEEMNPLIREMDQHYIKEMWTLALPLAPQSSIRQPWFKGDHQWGAAIEHLVSILQYMWVDQELKKEMGN
ncbi:MAG: hypothetical protein CL694_10040 [Chloroflexi bacterium]|jgi:peptide/nickel transport system substrate-binding protein|nr:hypothetical protein [Chloroflexota bacterium]